uniref:C-type lectin domain-containing protein n=1 Tax=Astyanax mexicanus TaxID=7994 RepID=A0A8B9REU7_ASTMX
MKITGIVLFILGLCKLNATLIRHYYINEKMTWPDAQEYCRYHYEDLSTIQNLSELQLLSIGTAVYSWIGLHRNDENASEWNCSLSGLDCVRVLIRTTKWSATQCSTLSTFFCMKTLPELILMQQRKTWAQALDYCRAQYTDLASLQLEEENALALNVSQASRTEFVWIGLRFLAGQWFWINGHYLGYQAWGTEKQFYCPAQNLRCGALETKSAVWMPVNCEKEFNFICKKKEYNKQH